MPSYTVRDHHRRALSSGHATLADAEDHLHTEALAAAVHPGRRADRRLELLITCDTDTDNGTDNGTDNAGPAGPVVAVHRWLREPRP